MLSTYLLLFSAFVGFLLSDFFISAQVPVKITILNRITPNEPIRYKAEFYRSKNCRADIQRFIVKKLEEGMEEVGFRDQIIGIIAQGVSKSVKTVSIMQHTTLEPGEYVLRIYVISSCGLITRIDKYPDEPFEVVPE